MRGDSALHYARIGSNYKHTHHSCCFFINKVNTIITVNDNSGRGMFNDIVVEPYSSTQLTYECPSVGSCAINFVHNYNREQYDVCICFEDYKYNETYTFGYLPSNTDVNENEKCSSCRN